jgi:hypothetical protein
MSEVRHPRGEAPPPFKFKIMFFLDHPETIICYVGHVGLLEFGTDDTTQLGLADPRASRVCIGN